jgi:hypothetical protein
MLARSGLASYRSGPLLLRSFSRDLRAALTQPPPVANHFPATKHKIPQKRCANALCRDVRGTGWFMLMMVWLWVCGFGGRRASFLMSQLQKTELEKLKDGREWPEFRAGDAIEVWVRNMSCVMLIFA